MRTEQRTAGWHMSHAAFLTVALIALLVLGSGATLAQAQAQTEPFSSGSVVRVANTDGQRLNLRDGASVQHTIVAKLNAGETLTVTGVSQSAGGTRWLPVRTTGGQAGWVAADYVALVSAPSPTPTRTPTPAPTATPAPAASSDDGNQNESGAQPLEVEAKLKYPELDGREQEITVWVTRGGVPVPGAIVTLETDDGDDDERFRELDPTDDEGRTRRTFDVRHESGTVELRVEAVAPDGSEGRVIVSYFRR